MIVHICNNYVASKVHRKIVENISVLCGRYQWVFVPIRNKADSDKNSFQNSGVSFKYCRYPKFIKYFPLLKLIFNFLKFRNFYRDLNESEATVRILAHTLWTDGAIAYLGNRVFGIRYSVVVRNTDINIFIPKLLHYRWLVKRIILKSDGLIFVNNIYRKRLTELFPEFSDRIDRSFVIFNGIDDFWLNSRFFGRYSERDKVCYVGAFNKNKNIHGIYQSVKIAREINSNIKLVLIGGSEAEFLGLIRSDIKPYWVSVLGKINDKEMISRQLRQSFVFSMPSFSETFGLVYLEALSQGCNLICSKGEGVDGVISGDYITFVDPSDLRGISGAILSYYDKDYPSLHKEAISNFLDDFSWDRVAKKYLDATPS